MTKRNLGVAAVFLLGCATGGVSSQTVVPKASAQQQATLTKWEYNCLDLDDDEATGAANKLGAESWEMVGISRYRTSSPVSSARRCERALTRLADA
ncbi:MAG TPA: hypothetical protein VJN18_26915 [Polyangiaceae bacterium]|nr:hypothetical protein [Polyangiaceae bacterium]